LFNLSGAFMACLAAQQLYVLTVYFLACIFLLVALLDCTFSLLTGLPGSGGDLSTFSFRMTQINLASQQLVLDTFFGLGLNASRWV
jgi:hypothetical protein